MTQTIHIVTWAKARVTWTVTSDMDYTTWSCWARRTGDFHWRQSNLDCPYSDDTDYTYSNLYHSWSDLDCY